MEIVLSRDIANRRIFPAIDIAKSATRKEELLLDPGDLDRVRNFRRRLLELGSVEGAQYLVDQLQKYPTNQELLAAFK